MNLLPDQPKMSTKRNRQTDFEVPREDIKVECKMDAADNSFSNGSTTDCHPQSFSNRVQENSPSLREGTVESHGQSNNYSYDNPAFLSCDQCPPGQHQETRPGKTEKSRRPSVIRVVLSVVLVLLTGAGVGIFFGVVFQGKIDIRTTISPSMLTGFTAELLLMDKVWDSRLYDTASPQFVSMKNDVEFDIDTIMESSNLSSRYRGVEVQSFSPGSIIAETTIKILSNNLSSSSFLVIFLQSYDNIDKYVLRSLRALNTTALTFTIRSTTTAPTTKGSDICRDNSKAVPLISKCFKMETFNTFTTDIQRCRYLEGVGNCIEVRIETEYDVECTFEDQIFLLTSNDDLIRFLLNFDIISKCNFGK